MRGTVQADILKEDQAQNTCIFSTEFALRMMGDIQQYFIENEVRNFYSVSISGYHIAEAGANPISPAGLHPVQRFHVRRVLPVAGHAHRRLRPEPERSSSATVIDPEYTVIGRVARRIWAKAMQAIKYGGNERSQKLKYHIQTSGRSLHAQEIAFNDIRTTLQALTRSTTTATRCTPTRTTRRSPRRPKRACAEPWRSSSSSTRSSGLARNENPLQGSFIIEELTDLVEQAVLTEFRRISERGGRAREPMERMYQRTKIQEESLYYESLKHSGKMPIVGVNTYLDSKGSPTIIPEEVIRSTDDEKEFAIDTRDGFQSRNAETGRDALAALQRTAVENGNTFDALMEACKVCTLGQLSAALYSVGGKYRRNM